MSRILAGITPALRHAKNRRFVQKDTIRPLYPLKYIQSATSLPLFPWACNLAGLSPPLHPRGTRSHKHDRDGAAGRKGDIFAQRGVTFSRNDGTAWLTVPSIRGLFILVTSSRWVLRVAAESRGLLTSAFSQHGALLYYEGAL